MHIQLRERDVEAFFGEGLVNPLVHAEKHAPIVGRTDPGAHGDIDRAVVQFQQLNERFGRFQDALVLVAETPQHGFGLVVVVALSNREHPIQTTGFEL